MKKAYLKKVKSMRQTTSILQSKPYMWDYYLTDIDNDNKAELLIYYGSCEADARLMVFKYTGGKLKKIGTVPINHCGFYAYPGSNGIIVMTGHMFYEQMIKIYVKNNKLVRSTISSRSVKNVGQYLTMPYELKGHEHYTSDYSKRYFDYNELK